MYVCMCLAVKDGDIKEALREGCRTLAEIQAATLAGTCCGACCDAIEELVTEAKDGGDGPSSRPAAVGSGRRTA